MLAQRSAIGTAAPARAASRRRVPLAAPPTAARLPALCTRIARGPAVAGRRCTSTPPTQAAAGDSAAVAVEAASPAPAPGPAPAPDAPAFSWHRQWWPIAVAAQLDPARPTAAMLLGIPLAIWRDKEGRWAVVEDRCPHRLAPLSEGRVEPSDGTLQCVYHGWRFDSTGACKEIPQIDDDRARATACASSRACVRSFPCQTKAGLLWVWADPGSPPPPEAQPAIAEELSQPGWTLLGGDWFARDLEYSYETLQENLFDPSHIPFAHHKIMGSATRDKATPLGEIQTREDISPKGFKLWRDTAPFRIPQTMVTVNNFRPPALNSSTQTSSTGRTFMLQFYGVPVAPGKSKIFAGFISNMQLPPPLRGILPLFEPVFHLGQQVVLDSDAFLLHVQERLLAKSPGGWRRSFYLPATADTGVIKFRSWFDEVGGGAIPWPPGTSADLGPVLPREVVLDRYSQHGKDCKTCRRAVAWIERLQAACTAIAAVAAPIGVYTLLQQALASAAASAAPAAVAAGVVGAAAAGGILGWPLLLLAAAALYARHRLQQQWKRFHFTDYVHAAVP